MEQAPSFDRSLAFVRHPGSTQNKRRADHSFGCSFRMWRVNVAWTWKRRLHTSHPSGAKWS